MNIIKHIGIYNAYKIKTNNKLENKIKLNLSKQVGLSNKTTPKNPSINNIINYTTVNYYRSILK